MPLICKFCNYEFQRSCHNHQVLKECTKRVALTMPFMCVLRPAKTRHNSLRSQLRAVVEVDKFLSLHNPVVSSIKCRPLNMD